MVSKNSNIKLKDRKLNQGQLEVLLKLYRYRFGTRELIADSLGKSDMSIYLRLQTLIANGYVASRYDKNHKLSGKPAAYYLLPKGLRALKQYTNRDDITDAAIKNSYKDKDELVSEQFIDHNLVVYIIGNRLQTLYPDIKQFTKRELIIYNYFPKQLPDLYLSIKLGDQIKRLFLDYIEASTPSFVIDRQLRQKIEYYQNGGWQAKGNPFPPILYVCETGNLEKRLQKLANKALYRSDTDMTVYTTTKNALGSASPKNDLIWSNVKAPDELISLDVM
jgi:DNA-binding PadR family transcriptional regulator